MPASSRSAAAWLWLSETGNEASEEQVSHLEYGRWLVKQGRVSEMDMPDLGKKDGVRALTQHVKDTPKEHVRETIEQWIELFDAVKVKLAEQEKE